MGSLFYAYYIDPVRDRSPTIKRRWTTVKEYYLLIFFITGKLLKNRCRKPVLISNGVDKKGEKCYTAAQFYGSRKDSTYRSK